MEVRGRSEFTESEAAEIRSLLAEKVDADYDRQKRIRSQLRGYYSFYISSFGFWPSGFGPHDFENLIDKGSIRIVS